MAANALDVACSQILQQQWAAAGITVQIKPMETAPLIQMYVEGTYPNLLSVALGWQPDPDAILQRMLSTTGFGQSHGMDDTELDAMIIAARAEIDNMKQNPNCRKFGRITDQAYTLQIYRAPPALGAVVERRAGVSSARGEHPLLPAHRGARRPETSGA